MLELGNRKGYLKTVEAVVALLIVLGGILFVISSNNAKNDAGVPEEIESMKETVFEWAENDPIFRAAVLRGDLVYVVHYVSIWYGVPPGVNYRMSLDNYTTYPEFEGKDVYVDSLIFANETGTVRKLILYFFKDTA